METYLAIMTKIPAWGLLSLSAMSVISGDYLAKLWSTNRNGWILLACLVAYSFSGVFYTPTLLRNGLVITSIIWSIVSAVGFLAIGLVIFKEQMSTAEGIGVAFGTVSLLILAFASELK